MSVDRSGEFHLLSKTSQITSLPGVQKRNSADIVDDTLLPKRNNDAFKSKVSKDFSSSVSCLKPLKNDNVYNNI